MSNYYEKYLKYKEKYINLKNINIKMKIQNIKGSGNGDDSKCVDSKCDDSKCVDSDNDDFILGYLVELVKSQFWIVYGENKNITRDDRSKLANESIVYLISLCKKHFETKVIEYVDRRDKGIGKNMEKIQKEVLDMLNPKIKSLGWEIRPTSSFSGGIYLDGDSDIDFTILIEKKDDVKEKVKEGDVKESDVKEKVKEGDVKKEEDLLEGDFKKAAVLLNPHGFKYKETKCKNKSDEYIVFSKLFKDEEKEIEVEIKVRYKKPAERIMKVHDYMDHHYPPDDKKYITYLKKLIKSKDKRVYSYLKYLISEDALFRSGWKGELYGNHIKRDNVPM